MTQKISDPIFQVALDLWSKQIVSTVEVTDEKLKELYSKQDLNVAAKYKLRNILVKSDEEAVSLEKEFSKYSGEELKSKFIVTVKEKSVDPATKVKEGDSGWVDLCQTLDSPFIFV